MRGQASRITAMVAAFGDLMLDAITPAEVERFLDGLLKDRSPSTRNRYRTLLHAMLNRARRHGRIPVNPVQGVGKFREPEGRVLLGGPIETLRSPPSARSPGIGLPTLWSPRPPKVAGPDRTGKFAPRGQKGVALSLRDGRPRGPL
jgi:hypothetical protein